MRSKGLEGGTGPEDTQGAKEASGGRAYERRGTMEGVSGSRLSGYKG